jgi:uncharacterized membrane protein
MKNNFTKEIILAVVIVVLLVFLINPFMFWMPDMVHMIVLALLIIAAAIFVTFVFKERAHDEREAVHRALAGRVAFLVGTTLAIIGIVWQTVVTHAVDPWLPVTLGGMIIGKIVALMWSQMKY